MKKRLKLTITAILLFFIAGSVFGDQAYQNTSKGDIAAYNYFPKAMQFFIMPTFISSSSKGNLYAESTKIGKAEKIF